MEIAFVGDIDLAAASEAVQKAGRTEVFLDEPSLIQEVQRTGNVIVTDDPLDLLRREELKVDVIVEASNTIGPAARYCLAAVERGVDVVLMNAEVDLAVGTVLQREAARSGAVVTSDAGDQHGVLKAMIDEIRLWGFRIVQAGNMKGFLNRYATPGLMKEEAAKRNLSPVQCCAYTDGTKLSIEMACLANSEGLTPVVPGMEGPEAAHVSEVMELFDFEGYGDQGRVDYVLGAEPGPGVYVVGHCDDPLQAGYMNYYKMGSGPYYLFYRPYHLCHIETPRAIAEAVMHRRPLMTPDAGRLTDVYAYAKGELPAGTEIDHGIGGAAFYGLIETTVDADKAEGVPVALLEGEAEALPRLTRSLAKDERLTWDAVDLPDTFLSRRWQEEYRNNICVGT
ncbi:MAG: homoserine dehydrogenase [Verrucomicrobiota bacterium]